MGCLSLGHEYHIAPTDPPSQVLESAVSGLLTQSLSIKQCHYFLECPITGRFPDTTRRSIFGRTRGAKPWRMISDIGSKRAG
jgi:hypothetical protein